MTPRQLESRIRALRGSLRRLLALHGCSWVLGLIVPLVILAGFFDWLFQLDSVIRAVLLAALVGTALYLAYRRVLRPLFVRFADLDIAMRIEERWPGLNDRLASTIQFVRLDATDESHGSPAMRAATIRQAVEEVSSIDFREVIEPRPVVKALGVAAGVLCAGALLLQVAPVSSRIALTRLFVPFGSTNWPRQTHLVLDTGQTTLKVARGDSFTLSVKVRLGDRIPDSAQVTYRFADGEESGEPLRSVEGGEFRGRIDTVNQPFRFSVAAGDDSTSIRDITVQVVPPPAMKSLAVRLEAPEYTGVPSQLLAPGLTQFRALEGTRLELEGVANKPLARAELRRGDRPAGSPLACDQSGARFKTTLAVSGNFSFWFELKDTEGFQNREAVHYDVRGFRDEAPRVVIEEPKTDRDVPADATIPVKVVLDDDFGLHSSRLIYRLATGDSEPHAEVAIPLWTDPNQGKPGASGFVKHYEVSPKWELAPLKLPVGTIITLYADARDYDSLKGPNFGKSREIRLRIVSKEDAARQFEDSQREVREEIARVLTMQKQAITPVENAARTLSQIDRLPAKERDDLNNGAMIQRQVSGRINNRDEGIGARIRNSLDDQRNFKIDNPDAQKQLEDMLARLEVIREQHLGPAEQGLTRAIKSLDAKNGSPPNAQPAAGPSEPSARTDSAQQAESKPAGAEKAAAAPAAKAGSQEPKSGTPKQSPDAARGDSERDDSPKQSGDASKGTNQNGEASKGNDQKGDASKANAEKGNASNGSNQKGEASKGSNEPAEAAQAGSKPDAPSSTPTKPGSDATQLALAESKTNQKAIAGELQKMLDSLSEFETYRGVVKDAQELLKQHEQTMKQTDEAAAKPDAMGRPLDALTQEQKTELADLAGRQSQVGKNLQNLLERMGEMAGRLNESDPLAASAMREAADKSRQQGTAGKLGEAADQLEKNRMGDAKSRQEQARDDLRDLVDAIQNRRERELSRLVKELKNAEAELAKTREKQAQNLKKTREAQKNPNAKERGDQLKRLAKEQAEIQKDLKKQLQKLAKLGADRAGRAGQSASGKMGRAQEDLDDDQGDEAGKEQEEALADLENAQEELEETRRDAEEQLAMEQLARMGDRLKSLAERQEKIVTETKSYQEKRQKTDGKLTTAQRAGVKGLGQVQSGIKDETADLIENLEGAPVFALTLRRASKSMEETATRLGELKTDTKTEQAAKAASDRFKQLIESLRADAAAGQGGGGGGSGGGGGGGAANGGNGDGIPAAAQLKMLKSLQQEINERTEALDELKRRNHELSPDQTAELRQIGEEQGTLADLVREMTRPKREDGEE
jgi:hypothetical protein